MTTVRVAIAIHTIAAPSGALADDVIIRDPTFEQFASLTATSVTGTTRPQFTSPAAASVLTAEELNYIGVRNIPDAWYRAYVDYSKHDDTELGDGHATGDAWDMGRIGVRYDCEDDANRIFVKAELQSGDFDDRLLWGAVGRAVRTPTFADESRTFVNRALPPGTFGAGSPPVLNLVLSNRNLKSEDSIAYRLGWRGRWGNDAMLSASVFYNDYERYYLGICARRGCTTRGANRRARRCVEAQYRGRDRSIDS